jgi:hypothetical protein
LLVCAINDTSLQVTNALELSEIHTDKAGSRLEFSWVATALHQTSSLMAIANHRW